MARSVMRNGSVMMPLSMPMARTYGRLLLDWYVSQCGPGMMVVCRCPPQAEVMTEMLERRGFEHRYTIESNKHFYWQKPV